MFTSYTLAVIRWIYREKERPAAPALFFFGPQKKENLGLGRSFSDVPPFQLYRPLEYIEPAFFESESDVVKDAKRQRT